MRALFVLAFMLTLTFGAVSQTRINVTMVVDSVEREFIVSKPSGATPAGGYPVVFMFHGTKQTGEAMYDNTQWKERGEIEKFITVFPTALQYCYFDDDSLPVTGTKWHNGELESIACPDQYLRNDVRFVRMMVDTLRKTFAINNGKIFASGFSNGAGFVNKLAVEMSDVFSAIGASSGTLNPRDSGTALRRIPIALVIGTLDRPFLKPGFWDEVPFNDSCLLIVGGSIRRVLAVENLENSYVKTATASALTYHYEMRGSGAPIPDTAANDFTFVILKDMQHVYPNGSTYPIKIADYYWEFFKARTATSGVAVHTQVPSSISFIPNPASDFVVVPGTGDMTMSMYSMLGQKVLRVQSSRGRRISIAEIPNGLYLVDIITNGVHTTSTLKVDSQ